MMTTGKQIHLRHITTTCIKLTVRYCMTAQM